VKRIHFIINGLYKHTERTISEIEYLFGKEYLASVSVTNGNGDATKLSREAVKSGVDYLIAAGGDGTMNEVVNGIMLVEKEKRKNLAVGLYPLGSGNDFARTMKISNKLFSLYELIKNNSPVPLDIGKLEYKKMNDENGIRYFNNIADIGLGAEVAKRVNEGKKMYGPNFDFFKATVVSFFRYKRKHLKITSDEFNWSGSLLILCLANAKYFGSGMCIAPHAIVDDGKFSIMLAGNVSLIDYLKYLPQIRKGEIINHPELYYKEVEFCSIEPIGEPCLIETDGEMIGKIPLKATMLKHEINFLAPKNGN
jgi:YegS/Rv2252/BmrU family lipid kinase